MKGWRLPAALLLFAWAIGAITSVVSADAPYLDPEQRYTFILPSGLIPLPASFFTATAEKFPSIQQVGYFFPRFPGATVVVSVLADVPNGATLDTVAAQNAFLPGFSPSGQGSQRVTIGGLPAIRQESVGPPIGGRIRMLQISAFNESAIYTITFAAKDSDFPVFLAATASIIDSFALVPRKVSATNPTLTNGRFTDAAGRFSIAVPTGWKAADSMEEPIVVSLRSEKPIADANVSAQAFDDGSVTLEEYADAQRDAVAEEYPDQHQTTQARATLGAEPAIRAEYTVTREGVPTRIIHVVAIHNRVGYLFEAVVPQTSVAAVALQVDEMIGSWRFN